MVADGGFPFSLLGNAEEDKVLFPVPGQSYPSETVEMLTRVSRFGPVFSRLLSHSPARFVTQSKTTGAAGSTAVTELHPPADKAGHGEVSQYVKVSSSHICFSP